MTKFVYNNIENIGTNHTFFKLNCGYHPYISFKDEMNPYSKFCSADKLAKKVRNRIFIYQQNLLHT